jgi:hypothetical protein
MVIVGDLGLPQVKNFIIIMHFRGQSPWFEPRQKLRELKPACSPPYPLFPPSGSKACDFI